MSGPALINMALPAIPAPVFDVLWRRHRLPGPPFPIAVHPDANGQSQAVRWLLLNRLGDADRTDSELTLALYTLGESTSGLWLRYAGLRGPTTVGCYRTESGRALRVVQRCGTVEIGWCHARRMTEAAFDVLPEPASESGRPVQVPLLALIRAGELWRRTGSLGHATDLLANAAGAVNAERFLQLYTSATGIGQVGALSGGAPAPSPPLTFLDTPDGRVAVAHNHGWVILVPADHTVMSARVHSPVR